MKIKATDDFLRDLHQPADKCLVVGEPEMLVSLEEKLRQELGKRINVYRSEAFYLELVPKGIDKAASLSRLLERTRIKQEEVIAIGDGYGYSTQWARLELPKPGTLEFAVRYSCLDLNDSDADILGGQQQQFTFGCNYYWKQFIRLRLNYNFAHLDKHALNGKENFNFISARVQVFLN